MVEKMMNKLLSARYILALICGAVFAYLAITKSLSVESVTGILTLVFVSYFSKKRGNNVDKN